jgi:hypothetical protein
MSFLSTLGKIFKGFAVGSQVASQVAPLVPGTAGGILAGIGGIGTIVGTVEGVLEKSIPGSQKLALAAPIVEQAILAELSAKGFKIGDDAKFKTAISELTSATVDLYNALEAPLAGAVASPPTVTIQGGTTHPPGHTDPSTTGG